MSRAAPDVREAGPVPAILVVDDNPVKRLAIRALLAPLCCPLVEVGSGRAALEALSRQTFALVLMDVRMPTLGGFETAKLIRQQGNGGRTPIIFVTALRGDDEEVASASTSGAVDFVFTPIVPDVLRAKVSALVALFLQADEHQRSHTPITTFNAPLRESNIGTQVGRRVAPGSYPDAESGGVGRPLERS